MPTFKVFLQKEVVEEVAVIIEANEEEDITDKCLSSIIFEGVGAVKSPGKWKAIVHDIYLDPDRVEEVNKKPEFILEKYDGDWVLLTAPKKPRVDPRQLPLIEESKDV